MTEHERSTFSITKEAWEKQYQSLQVPDSLSKTIGIVAGTCVTVGNVVSGTIAGVRDVIEGMYAELDREVEKANRYEGPNK